jgi:hypothetical protein
VGHQQQQIWQQQQQHHHLQGPAAGRARCRLLLLLCA